MVTCTSCGCSWDEKEGYYHSDEGIEQPCIECRLDTQSIYYLNNRDTILNSKRTAYYNDHEASKAYYREYRRLRRTQATA